MKSEQHKFDSNTTDMTFQNFYQLACLKKHKKVFNNNRVFFIWWNPNPLQRSFFSQLVIEKNIQSYTYLFIAGIKPRSQTFFRIVYLINIGKFVKPKYIRTTEY